MPILLAALALVLADPAAAGAQARGSGPLPAVAIETDARTRLSGRVDGAVRVSGFDGPASIGVRGRWSRRYPKKSYRVELRDESGGKEDAALLGMPADDDWVLYAAFDDRTLMRNVLAYETARWMGRYAVRTRHVELPASTYLSGSPGRALRLGPVWDFDVAMGASRRGPSRFLAGWMLANRPWARQLYHERAFTRAMHRRWGELRGGGLRERLVREVRTTAAALAPAARRDVARWPSGAGRAAGSTRGHVERLESWLRRRVAWLDRNLPVLARRGPVAGMTRR